MATLRRSRRRHLLGAIGLYGYSEPRTVVPDVEYGSQSSGPAVHGRVAHLRPGNGEPESSRLRCLVSERSHYSRIAAVEQRVPAGHQPGYLYLESSADG